VVSDQQHPVSAGPNVRIIRLDAPMRLQPQIGKGLSANAQDAAARIKRRLEASNAQLHRKLASSYQDVIDAWRVGVQKIPAVVIDQRYVVYGEPNVARAVSTIEQYRRLHP
jgi:integrating conjugative element protein (TIGR03757 family)